MQRHCESQLKRKLHLGNSFKDLNDDVTSSKLRARLEVFEDEVITRQKELLRAYSSLQKENVGI